MKDAIKWGTDYLIKAHPEPNLFIGQVGNGVEDHKFWGRPENMTMDRPVYFLDPSKPGSDLAGESAAALAAASIIFKDSDPTYSSLCLDHAKDLFNFANTYRGKYSDSISDAAIFYKTWGKVEDELAWAAAWLYKATEENSYLTIAENIYSSSGIGNLANEFSWEQKDPGAQVLLAELTKKQVYIDDVTSFCENIVDMFLFT